LQQVPEERKAIQSKIPNVCILCLGPKGGKHDCPVTKCPRCGAMHNVLLCPAEEEDRAFVLNENNEWTENDKALGNPEMCYLIRKVQPKEHNEVGKTQITGIKNALKELSTEQKTSNTRDDRAAFVQVGRVEHVRILHETCSYENSSDNEGISDKNGSTESENEFLTATESERENKKIKELTESDLGDQNTSDSEEEAAKEKKERKAPTKNVKGKKRKVRRELD